MHSLELNSLELNSLELKIHWSACLVGKKITKTLWDFGLSVLAIFLASLFSLQRVVVVLWGPFDCIPGLGKVVESFLFIPTCKKGPVKQPSHAYFG